MAIQVHEIELDSYTIDALRTCGQIWVYFKPSAKVSIGDAVIVYAGAKTQEFLHPSVFAAEIINVDFNWSEVATVPIEDDERVLIRYVKTLAAIAL